MVSEQCLLILVNMLSSISLSALADRDLNMLGSYFSQFAYEVDFYFWKYYNFSTFTIILIKIDTSTVVAMTKCLTLGFFNGEIKS